VCQTQFMATFLLRLKNQLTAVTLGSPYDVKHFHSFCDYQRQALDQLLKESLHCSEAVQFGCLNASGERLER
jgi:hypothetical protein